MEQGKIGQIKQYVALACNVLNSILIDHRLTPHKPSNKVSDVA